MESEGSREGSDRQICTVKGNNDRADESTGSVPAAAAERTDYDEPWNIKQEA
jgi:hypothetical protein